MISNRLSSSMVPQTQRLVNAQFRIHRTRQRPGHRDGIPPNFNETCLGVLPAATILVAVRWSGTGKAYSHFEH